MTSLDHIVTQEFHGSETLKLDRVVAVFHRCFAEEFRIRLVGGADEPEYRPAAGDLGQNVIQFTRDYLNSALHEVAHWCVAGSQRRLQHDYGYWYAPDGRTSEQQHAFEQAEVRPQALEWMFSVACGHRFRVSADNLEAGLGPSDEFREAIRDQALRFCDLGVPLRAERFIRALSRAFGTGDLVIRRAFEAQPPR